MIIWKRGARCRFDRRDFVRPRSSRARQLPDIKRTCSVFGCVEGNQEIARAAARRSRVIRFESFKDSGPRRRLRLKGVAPSQGKLTSFVGESGVKVEGATSLNICAAMVGNALSWSRRYRRTVVFVPLNSTERIRMVRGERESSSGCICINKIRACNR